MYVASWQKHIIKFTKMIKVFKDQWNNKQIFWPLRCEHNIILPPFKWLWQTCSQTVANLHIQQTQSNIIRCLATWQM